MGHSFLTRTLVLGFPIDHLLKLVLTTPVQVRRLTYRPPLQPPTNAQTALRLVSAPLL
jgi:hypothetical protein